MSQPRVLLYGGRGALGSSCLKYFKDKGYWVSNIDLTANDEADNNVIVENVDNWVQQSEDVLSKVSNLLKDEKVDGIVCVAGGWAGGNAASADLVKNADLMWKQSVWSSTIAAALGAKHLKDGGSLILTGAQPALKHTPGMMGYGMAKAAVHQLTKSLAAKNSGLPSESFVSAILPITLSTEMNRKNMPNGDHSKWTPLETVAEILHGWIEGKDRPQSGSLVKLVTKDNKTECVIE